MQTFREWLNINQSDDTIKITQWKDYLNEQFVIESFDSSHKIIKVERGNPDFHYFNIDSHEFKIFVEKDTADSTNLHIGFEYKDPIKGWVIDRIYDILNAKNILGLFGTIYLVLKSYNFNAVMFCSHEDKKFRTYVRLMSKLAKEFNVKHVSNNGECIFMFDAEYVPDFKCSYKCKKNKYK